MNINIASYNGLNFNNISPVAQKKTIKDESTPTSNAQKTESNTQKTELVEKTQQDGEFKTAFNKAKKSAFADSLSIFTAILKNQSFDNPVSPGEMLIYLALIQQVQRAGDGTENVNNTKDSDNAENNTNNDSSTAQDKQAHSYPANSEGSVNMQVNVTNIDIAV